MPVSHATRFRNKACLVTGGGSGIGRAVCLRLAAGGASVMAVDLNPEHGRETQRLIESSGGQAMFAQADVSNSTQVRSAINAAVQRWQRIDVLVNDAAMMTS